jgi:four helix bundle protein
MPQFALDSLRVYARAEELADLIWSDVMTWPPFARNTVGNQLVRAADSVGANIAEGYGRASAGDRQRFVRIGGSLYEVRHFLRGAERRGLIAMERQKLLQLLIEELMPSLNAYLRTLARHDS